MFDIIIASNPKFWGRARKDLLKKVLLLTGEKKKLSKEELDKFRGCPR